MKTFAIASIIEFGNNTVKQHAKMTFDAKMTFVDNELICPSIFKKVK